jgi:hypothetical protein
MDKTNAREIRIDPASEAANNGCMSEETADALFARATDLAYQAFEDATDDHIETIYHRIVFNHRCGAGEAGAVTVH